MPEPSFGNKYICLHTPDVHSSSRSWVVLSNILASSAMINSRSISSFFNPHERASSPLHCIFFRSSSNWVDFCFHSGIASTIILNETYIALYLLAILPTRTTDTDLQTQIETRSVDTDCSLVAPKAKIFILSHHSFTLLAQEYEKYKCEIKMKRLAIYFFFPITSQNYAKF